jgi:cytochrome c-type biogenesis protein CcmF
VIPELGHYALILALCLAILQVILPIIGVARANVAYQSATPYLAIGQLIFVGVSFFALAYAFITNDFTVAYVAENSNTHLPLIYRFCAVWGAHEGSLLLWVFILTLWMAAVSILSRHLPLDMLARVLAVLALVAIGFYLLILITSDPFTRLFIGVPTNGNGLNPLLQDPGLVTHPPILYMGYVGFSVAFAFAIAALWGGRFDTVWIRWSRPWTLAAWSFLTGGIVLGSWWAYRELGWGGWWFWDPVENASFLPWLVGTALIHSLAVSAKRDVFKAWTVLLAVCAFSLSLMGTFLVRSGVLISVHAFASDPKRGAFILQFLTIVIGGSLLLYALRGRKLVNSGNFDFWSRESLLLANNVILFAAMLTVLLGTLYPLIVDALGLGKISVGPPYFNLVFIPLMVPLLFLMGAAPAFYWGQSNPRLFLRRFALVFIFSMVLALLLPLFFGVEFKFSVWMGLALTFWILLNLLVDLMPMRYRYRSQLQPIRQRSWSMMFAHAGMIVTVTGIVLSLAYSDQRDLVMKIGEITQIKDYQFQLTAVNNLNGPNYHGATATVLVSENNQLISTLYPEMRIYDVEQSDLSKTAIDVSVFRDLYVALGQPLNNGEWAMRIYYKPFVRWIWVGGLLMVVGGAIAVLGRRYRKRIEL